MTASGIFNRPSALLPPEGLARPSKANHRVPGSNRSGLSRFSKKKVRNSRLERLLQEALKWFPDHREAKATSQVCERIESRKKSPYARLLTQFEEFLTNSNIRNRESCPAISHTW